MNDAPTADVLLRTATVVDLPFILGLYDQPGLDDGKTLSVEEAAAILDRFSRYPNYRLFVACRGQAVVGSYALLIMDNLAHCGAPSAVVEDVVVAPHAQSSGVGRAMMLHAMRLAGEAGCYKLALSSASHRHDAHAFYDRLGFTRHGISFVVENSA
jgi:GNAT superfamily N-acetyltransferase